MSGLVGELACMLSDENSKYCSEGQDASALGPQQQVDPGAQSAGLQPDTVRYPLTIAQTSIVLDALYLPNSPVANTGDIAHIDGHIDTRLFAAACRQVVAETASIRASFHFREDSLVQKFLDLDDYVLEQRDYSASEQPEHSAQTWIEDNFWTPLPWNGFPLFHLVLIKIRDDRHVFLQKLHHGLADAIGRFLLFRRIACVYEALIQGVPPVPVETFSIPSRIAEETAYLGSDTYEADIAYWKTRFHVLPDPLVDADRSRTERIRSGRSQSITFDIAPDAFSHLKATVTALGTSVPRLALALTYVAVSRLYGATDVVIGFPLHNRATETSKRSIDLSMTVMPFRVNLDSELTIAKLLKKIGAMLVADRRHSRFPFSSLSHLTGQGQAGQSLFDIMVNYIPAMGDISLGGARISYNNYSAGFYSPWAIDIRETHDGQGAKLTVAFDPGLIEFDAAARLAKSLNFLLTSPIDFARHTIGNVPIISNEERHHLLVELNCHDVPVPADATLVSLCASQADRTPDAVAVTHGTQSITYAQLHAKAETLALRLLEAGVRQEDIVGVSLPRNIDLIVALLAIHKAGGAYLPLDPTLPAQRIAYMISDAQARLVVTTRALAQHFPETLVNRFFLDDPGLIASPSCGARPPVCLAVHPDSLAYVIYTSGSTGSPKGVAVEHRSAANLILHQISQLEPQDLAGSLFSTSLNFDVSVDEIFVSLASGGRLIMVENLLALPAAPAGHEVSILGAVPSVFDALLQIGGFHPGVRLIRFAGEALPRSLVDRAFAIDPNVRIMNIYGPTEATVYTTFSYIRSADRDPPPIGKGLWNIKLYVLDKNMEPLPKGAKGELYIGGTGVARGYLNKPELTAERFVKNPFGEGRLYRTGDFVRWRKDGELDYLGRIDTQVKIDGLRIELGEIERQLESMAEIASAVAVVRPDDQGTKRIFAFAVSGDKANQPDISTVNNRLDGKLPKYMLPAAITWTETFPLTVSGKLDRNALSLPAWKSVERSHRGPTTRREASLLSMWKQVLKIPKIGIDDDFFDLGGTSLQAVMIFARIAQVYGLDLPAVTIVSAPTIARLAAFLKEASGTDGNNRLIAFRKNGYGFPLFFVHGGGGGVMYVRDLMHDFRNINPLYGLQSPPLDGTGRLPRSIEESAALYLDEIRTVQPFGPYHIFGFCSGGTIGFEMAQQLTHAGEAIALLGLIEPNPGKYFFAGKGSASATGKHAHGAYQNGIVLAAAKRIAEKIINRVNIVRNAAKSLGPRKGLTFARKVRFYAKVLGLELRYIFGYSIPHEHREFFYAWKFGAAEKRYTPKQYSGAITLFNRKIKLARTDAIWSMLASGRVIARELPVGSHYEITNLPNSRFLAAQIDASLNELRSCELHPVPSEN
jgi:enterobactin synthetase component F